MTDDVPSPSSSETPNARELEVDVVRHGSAWNDSDIADATVELAAQAAFTAALPELRTHYEATVVLTDDAEIRDLNRNWRNKDEATNVLSFPAGETANELIEAGESLALGDVVIAYEKTRAEAVEKAISIYDHVSHLVVHGVLHLLGFDHMDDAEAEQMEDLERKALATLGIADPYAREDGPDTDGETDLAEIVQ